MNNMFYNKLEVIIHDFFEGMDKSLFIVRVLLIY